MSAGFLTPLASLAASARPCPAKAHIMFLHVQTCMAAAEQLAKSGVEATVMDARFCKPLDEGLIRQLANSHSVRIAIHRGIANVLESDKPP